MNKLSKTDSAGKRNTKTLGVSLIHQNDYGTNFYKQTTAKEV